MSTYLNYYTLLHGSSFDSPSELWGDEVNNSQVFLFGNATTITYTYLSQIPTYYNQQDEGASFHVLSVQQISALDIIWAMSMMVTKVYLKMLLVLFFLLLVMNSMLIMWGL